MDKKENEQFIYTYSAKEQEEIKKIRKKYIPDEEDNMSKLRRLDASVNNKATTRSLMLGIIGTLIMGIGMSCTMVGTEEMFIPGILVGVVGIIIAGIAYPVYKRTLKKERNKIAPEIIRLTDELLK